MSLVHSLSEAAARLQRADTTPTALLDECLERIHAWEKTIHAWVCLDEDRARRDAQRMGEELASGKPPRSPLHGVAVGIKDIFDVAGLPTQAGSPLLRGNVATRDAALVARLRQAGAVIVGKTVTTEFACFDPSPTCNPWRVTHTPGGSSSGSAAALATGMCFAALGSQTGGSITRPASYCGVCGLKPTFGALSLQGVTPVSFHLDHPGPMARTVDDLTILWRLLSGEEGPDSHSENRPTPPRIGLLGEFFDERADAAVRAATQDAMQRLAQAGAQIKPLPLPQDFLEVHSNHRRIMAVEAAEHHRWQYHAHSDQYGPNISALIEEGLSITAVDYAAALKFQTTFRHEAMDLLTEVDVLATSATPTPAPSSLETTGDPAFNSPWSLAGLPTVCFPCGVSPEGLPCGLQLIGRWRGEEPLLDAARWCEKVLEFQNRPSSEETTPG
jgi:aspartyl-tRNA(Asn)/glutamyl-tRNA(Gln) amidotransferase subunit A